MVKATKLGLDILQWCSGHGSQWFKEVEFESAIAVWASVFSLKIAHAQLLVYFIYAAAVFGHKGPEFTLLNIYDVLIDC